MGGTASNDEGVDIAPPEARVFVSTQTRHQAGDGDGTPDSLLQAVLVTNHY